jgi:peptidoglycan/LPS O-acetylase OafA/YrhL
MKKIYEPLALEINRINPKQFTWPSLTGLRGLAAVWVFLLHVYTSAGEPSSIMAPFVWLFKMGWTGVDVFFTLSAFLLSMPYAQALRNHSATPSLMLYIKRRAARVLPAYYLQCIALGVLAFTGIAKAVFWYEPNWHTWLAHIFLWLNALPLVPALVPVWWTLPVELGFYVLLPLLAKCLTDKRWYFLLGGIVLSLLYRHWILSSGFGIQAALYWADHLPGRLFQFLIGMLAAFFFMKWRAGYFAIAATRNLAIFFSFAALIALPALLGAKANAVYGAPTSEGLMAYYHLFASIIIAVMLLALVSGKTWADSFLSVWPLQWLGKISYGLYLWHYPVMMVLRENMGGMQAIKSDFYHFLILSFLISVSLAFLSWHWLEAPILKRVSRTKV